ncbi:MAG TPA: DUF6746 family protein [Gammaproteobacteria bacterium]
MRSRAEPIREWFRHSRTETLESVHVASEKADGDNVKSQGRVYLEKARTLVR